MTRDEWEASTLAPALARTPDRHPDASTSTGRRVEIVYTPDDLAPRKSEATGAPAPRRASPDSGRPLGALWAIEQSAGDGLPDAANATLRRALAAGATALEVAFDHPTRLGLDPDDAPDVSDVGRRGVSIATVDDVSRLLEGIDLSTVPVTMAIDGPAAVLLACALVVAERRRIAWADVRMTLQHDVLGERLAGMETALPLDLATRMTTDVATFCREHAPSVRPIVVTERPWRAGDLNPGDQLVAMMARATSFVADAVASGTPVAEAGLAVSFRFRAGSDFFEDIARFRAVRRLWTSILATRFCVTEAEASRVPIYVNAGAGPAMVEERWDDVSRLSFQALAAVIGGVDVLQTATGGHPDGSDAGLASLVAVRAQQVIAHESGLAGERDAMRGAWFVERLTDDLCEQVTAGLAAIERLGGLGALIAQGRSLAEPFRASVQPTLSVPEVARGGTRSSTAVYDQGVDWSRERAERLRAWRRTRDSVAVNRLTGTIGRAVQQDEPVMPALIEAARAGATVGEMCEALRSGAQG